MADFRAIVFSAALAGLIVGGAVTALQMVSTVPLIQRAETYERAEAAPVAAAPAAGHAHDAAAPAGHAHPVAAWAPADGLERTAYTALFNVLEWIGFGMVLGGALSLSRRAVGWREGLLWGLGGFLAFVVAPGLGLPPELPGMPAAPLLARQAWWLGTVAATAGGLALIALRRSPWAAVAAVVLIVAPHVVGAPQVAGGESEVPEALARQFVVAVTVTALPCWALLGGLTGRFYRRFGAVG